MPETVSSKARFSRRKVSTGWPGSKATAEEVPPPDLFQRLAAPLREPLERRLITALPGQADLLRPFLDVAGVAVVAVRLVKR